MSLFLETRDMSSNLGATVQGKEKPPGDCWVRNEMHELNPACLWAGFVTEITSRDSGLSPSLWLCELQPQAAQTFPQCGDRLNPARARAPHSWSSLDPVSLSSVTQLAAQQRGESLGSDWEWCFWQGKDMERVWGGWKQGFWLGKDMDRV